MANTQLFITPYWGPMAFAGEVPVPIETIIIGVPGPEGSEGTPGTPGPNEVTDDTPTTIVGYLKGDGVTVSPQAPPIPKADLPAAAAYTDAKNLFIPGQRIEGNAELQGQHLRVRETLDAGSTQALFSVERTGGADVWVTLFSVTANGIVSAPTPAAGDNSTRVATTAFVAGNFALAASPTFSGTVTLPLTTRIPNTGMIQFRNVGNTAWQNGISLGTDDAFNYGSPATNGNFFGNSHVSFIFGGGTVYGLRILSQGGAGVLQLSQVTSLGTPSANTVVIGAKDVGGTAEFFAKDEAGNETQLSPHARDGPDGYEGMELVLRHSNDYEGELRWAYVERALRDLEGVTGKKYLHSKAIPKRDWDADQAEKQAVYDQERKDALDRHKDWKRRKMVWEESFPDMPFVELEPIVPPVQDIRKPKPGSRKPNRTSRRKRK